MLGELWMALEFRQRGMARAQRAVVKRVSGLALDAATLSTLAQV
jgi:hypothetical protein